MTFAVQQGPGMRDLCRKAKLVVPTCGIILGAKEFKSLDGLCDFINDLKCDRKGIMFDSQYYTASLGKEISREPPFSYWPTNSKSSILKAIDKVVDINQKMGLDNIILPGHYIKNVDEKTLSVLRDCVSAIKGCHKDVYLTLCLHDQFFRNDCQYNRLTALVEKSEVSGIYLLPERNDDDYFSEDPVWLCRLMELCADIKCVGKQVIVGYANHQMLLLSVAYADVIAAGKGRTTRSFRMSSFKRREEGDFGFAHPKPSYYCPQAFTEFSLKYMDLAHKKEVLPLMAPVDITSIKPVEMLFASGSPVSSGYRLQDGYLHYINAMCQQSAAASSEDSFESRMKWHLDRLKEAEDLLVVLHKHGVRGLLKDYLKYIGIARSALQTFSESRGVQLSMLCPK